MAFPTDLSSFSTKNTGDTVDEGHVNDLQTAVVNLETEVGITTTAIATTVNYFLLHASGNFRTHVHDGGSDDGSATLSPTTINAFSLGGKLTAGATEIEGSGFDINGGTIDGVTIGGASAPTVTDLGSVATCDINGGTIDGVTIGAGSAPTITDLGSVATCDINGGTIDGVTIGAASAPTVTDLGSVATCDINGGTMDGVQIGGTTATGELIVNNSSDDADGLGSQGTSGQLLTSAGVGANPTFSDALNTLEDYASSASTGTAKLLGNLIIHYGSVSVANGASQAVTNLNFSSNTSYAVITGVGISGGSNTGSTNIVKDTGAQFTVTNSDGATVIINWIAIGT